MGKVCQVADCPRDLYAKGYCEMHYRRVERQGEPGPPGPLRRRGECVAPECDEPVDAKDLCHGHYQRFDRHGEIDLSPLRKGKSMCQVESCDRDAVTRGYCRAHYRRVLIHGHPQADIPIREVSGDGYLNHGYRVIPVPPEFRHLTNGDSSSAEHRFVMAQHLGRALRNDENVHHINGVRTDNRLENLELWSTSQPSGKRVADLLEYAWILIDRYGEEFGTLNVWD